MYRVNTNILLETSKDGLYGYITLTNNEENKDIQLNLAEWRKKIREYFKFGLDEILMNRALDSGLIGEKICIAEGELPIAGKDGNIKYHFEMEKPLSPKLKLDGTVDYKELDSINTVKAGDVLASIIPPLEGENGINVIGEEIPHVKGKIPRLRYGKNVTLSPDGMNLISDINGLVELRNGSVIVSELLVLENLDNSVGNVDFQGNVIVNKDILNGFSLSAEGSVEIKGSIEGGYVECKGDILVRQGIQGYNRLTIDTRGDLSAKFIENSILNIGGNITAEAIMHSNVSSRSNILVLGRRGLIVGGSVRAKNEIRARTIGSSMATTTVLEVGIDPDIKQNYDELENKLKTNKENLVKIEQSLNVLEVMKRSSKLDSKKLELYNELVKAQLTLNIEINKTTKELERTKKEMENLSRGKIKVAEIVYPGVKIIIGNAFMYIKDELKRCTFYEEYGEIRIGPY